MSFLNLDGIQLHYQQLLPLESKGKETVVFLHGLVMDNLSSWFFTVANLAAQTRRVLLYDLRGHGMSARPKNGYSIDQHIEDLRQLLDHVGPEEPVILVGNSFGGLLALNFADRYPARVSGLILVDAQINDQAWRDDMLNSLKLQGDAQQEKIASNFKNWLGRHSERKSNRLARNAFELVHETSLLDDLYQSSYLSDADLKRLPMPVLAIYGEKSDIIGHADRLLQSLPQCQLKIFSDCTHSVLWEQTEAMRDLIVGTLNESADQCPEERQGQ